MVLILLATVLILAIAFFQVAQGLFSALVMTVLSMVCMAVAFTFFEPVGELLYPYQPACGDAIALAALFVLSLLILRILYDKFIPQNVVLGVWTNRVGGGILGLITAMILVGMLALVVQMLPLGPSVFTFSPYDATMTDRTRLAPFCPDDFVLGLAKMFSSKSLGSGDPNNTFSQVHDNMILELFAARNTAGKNGRVDASEKALAVSGTYASDGTWATDVPAISPMLGEVPSKVVVIRVSVNESARDADGWWRLPGSHFRLVCRKESGEATSYYPLGYMARSANLFECVPAPSKEGRLEMANLIVEHRRAGVGVLRLTGSTALTRRILRHSWSSAVSARPTCQRS